jgi:hypothetical protein
MKTVEFNESEQLALLAELARPLVHESNNFLNNLFLHMALFQDHLPAQLRGDWESVRQEGKQLEYLLREWQEHWRGSVGKTGRIELNLMITEIVERLCPKEHLAKFTMELFPEPLWLNGRTGELQRFCRLLLRHLLEINDGKDGTIDLPLTIQTARNGDIISLHIRDVGHVVATKGWAGFDEDENGCPSAFSLTTAACRSMARHIHGKIRTEKDTEGSCHLVVEFS